MGQFAQKLKSAEEACSVAAVIQSADGFISDERRSAQPAHDLQEQLQVWPVQHTHTRTHARTHAHRLCSRRHPLPCIRAVPNLPGLQAERAVRQLLNLPGTAESSELVMLAVLRLCHSSLARVAVS